MTQNTARELHQEAAMFREQGKLIDSLEKNNQAFVAFLAEGNTAKAAEVLADRAIVLKHFFEHTGDKSYLLLARHELLAGLEIGEGADKSYAALPYFELGKISDTLGDYKQAVEAYEMALKIFEDHPPLEHNRPAVVADIRLHLLVSMFKAGEKKVLDEIPNVIAELENSNEASVSKFNYDVWLSGAYMRFAELLFDKDEEKAKAYLAKAKVIIENNEELVHRKRQLSVLNEKLGLE